MAVKDFFIKSNDTLDNKDIWEVTPWQKDNSSAITKSKVDNQDELTLEDFLDGDEGASAGAALSSQLSQLVTQNGIYTAVNNIKTAIKNEEPDSIRPDGTVGQADDGMGIKLRKIKNNKLKRVKLLSKFGLYNTYMNLLGNAAGLFIGSLGKTSATQIADYALSKTRVSDFTLGLGVDSIRRIVKAAKDSGRDRGEFSSVDIPYDDIINLNLANFFTIYSSRPGLTVRSTNSLLQYIAKNGGRLETLKRAGGQAIEQFAGNFGIEINSDDGKPDNKTEAPLISLDQVYDFANKYTFLMPKVDEQDDSTIASFKIPSDGNSIKKGIIPQNFKVIEADEYKKQISRLAKKTEKAFNSDNLEERELNVKRQQLEDLEQQRKSYVENTIIHSKARINGGVEIGSLKDYIDKRYEYLKELFGDKLNIYKEDSDGNNIPMLMRKIEEDYKSNGGLYIEPFYGVDENVIQSFFIPFEFNPDIQESSSKSEYTNDKILGRIMPWRSYISSEPSGLTIITKYFALEGDIKIINGEAGINADESKYWSDYWQRYYKWDLKKIQYLEGLYRSLNLPYIKDAKFVRPPIIRVIPPCKNSTGYNNEEGKGKNQFSTVSDLYSYPNYNKNGNDNFEITRIFDKNEYNSRIKRYVATDIQISPLDENGWGNNFAFNSEGNCVRKGFKVNITLLETTKNFLDTIPSFASYVNKDLNTAILESGRKEQDFRNKYNNDVILPQENMIGWRSINAAEELKINEQNKSANNISSSTAPDSTVSTDFDFTDSKPETVNTKDVETKQENKLIESKLARTVKFEYLKEGKVELSEDIELFNTDHLKKLKKEKPEPAKESVGKNEGLTNTPDENIDSAK